VVKVRFYGSARRMAGAPELVLPDAAGLRLGELVARVGAAPDDRSAEKVDNLVVNGRNCMFLKGLDTVLADGDVVDVLPLVGGG
jgi:molybdopterin converting factor small subunit